MQWALSHLPLDLRPHVDHVADDILCGGSSLDEAQQRTTLVRRHFENLNAVINLGKSSACPTTDLDAVGFRVQHGHSRVLQPAYLALNSLLDWS